MMIETKYILPALLLMVFANFSCKEKQQTTAAPRANNGKMPLQAEGFIVKSETLSEDIEVPGTLMPYETTEIRPEISGRIVELNIPEGRVVQRGTVLVRLFDGDLQARLKKLEVQLSISEKTSERQNALLKISGISQQEYDLGQLEVNNLKADIQLVKVDIDRTRILAPYNGKVGLKNISLGAYITPANVLTTISQVDDLKLEFTVPEKYSVSMVKGKQVGFSIDGIKKSFTATVMASETVIEANTRSLRVRGIVKGNQQGLVPGGFAKVSLQMGKNDKALIIPTQAVIPQARNKQVAIYRGGKVEFKIVTTGIRDSSYIQIVEGLNAGDTVIVTGLLAIRPDSKVKLTKVQ